MFAAITETNFDHRSPFQRVLDRESAAAVRTQCQEVGLDDGAVAVFRQDHVDPTTPIFRRTSSAPRLFEMDFAGEWVRA
jgi:hypothetical protein